MVDYISFPPHSFPLSRVCVCVCCPGDDGEGGEGGEESEEEEEEEEGKRGGRSEDGEDGEEGENEEEQMEGLSQPDNTFEVVSPQLQYRMVPYKSCLDGSPKKAQIRKSQINCKYLRPSLPFLRTL